MRYTVVPSITCKSKGEVMLCARIDRPKVTASRNAMPTQWLLGPHNYPAGVSVVTQAHVSSASKGM
jgi:hypothetical protein